MHTKSNILLTAIALALLLPLSAWTMAAAPTRAATDVLFAQGQPFEQDLIVTAYYSPLPDQCCYVRGNFAADVVLNGEGIRGADGTDVYPGMAAAPPSYPFGTRIVVPGVGTVTVHDRGGAIQEWKHAHRLDLWAGAGEEGLARALAFGVRRVRAVVYPPASPKPAESLDLTLLPAPPDELRPYLSDGTTLLDIRAKLGERTASVQFLQERLRALGYFGDRPSGLFGRTTQESLRAFSVDAGIEEPEGRLTEFAAAHLEAAYQRRAAGIPLPSVVEAGSAPQRVAEAQRTLRFLGAYRGRTDGQYSEAFRQAVIAFQREQGIISSEEAPGAGRIGPQTRLRISALWRRKHIAMGAGRLLALQRIDQLLVQRGFDLQQFLSRGDRGNPVRALQKFLASKQYLGKYEVTGTFGARTEQALIAYQRDAGIIADASDPGAGYAGPATLARYRQDMRQGILRIVREKGWSAV